MDSLVFKDWLNYEEGIIGTAYNYLKNKIGSLLNFISDYRNTKEKKDFFVENGLIVFTEDYHLKRGYCCGSGCRFCPYTPKHKKGNTVRKEI